MKIKETLCFDDVLLVPKHFDGVSRRGIDISTKLGNVTIQIPILSANMPSVTELEMAIALGDAGGLGILHRMCSINDQTVMANNVKSVYNLPVGAAFGIGADWKERVKKLAEVNTDLFCLDVAHGDQKRVIEVVKEFLNDFPTKYLIVGNVANYGLIGRLYGLNGFERLIFKVGVGGGSKCLTRVNTGCGMPTLQSIMDIRSAFSNVPLIADGGIKTSGDIVKALAAGANAVMCGSLLAGTDECPGDVIKGQDGNRYKIYRGSASYAEKQKYFGDAEYIEGEEGLVPYKRSVNKVVKRLAEGVRSGFSYCGAHNLEELWYNAEFIKVSSSGYKEGLAHGNL